MRFALTAALTISTAGLAQQPDRPDLLTFAAGAVPVSIGGAGQKLGADFEKAVRAMDGDPGKFSLFARPGDANTETEFVYKLPALTTFDRFAVPDVIETPAPTQTFVKTVEVYGSATSATGGFVLLGSGTLTAHGQKGEVSELAVKARTPVMWIKLKLIGGIQTADKNFLEFSEIIGNGTQQTPSMDTRFTGTWRERAFVLGLTQKGAVVTGCYDRTGKLTGTVTGNILRATGVDQSTKVPSGFLLQVSDDGSIRGVRSDNRGPFRLITAPAIADPAVECSEPPPARLGCGSIIHGINFDYDSHAIRKESEPVLLELFKGLDAEQSVSMVIEGHTSSEGTNEYNQSLSERRARAIVDDLVRRGIPVKRLRAAGIGEVRPIASNNDESGRSLNRRVEVKCS